MRKQNGITLIALVITIIVLLILAGVSIAMLTGDNGILTQASRAKTDSERAEIAERINVELNAFKTDLLADGKINDSTVEISDSALGDDYSISETTANPITITHTETGIIGKLYTAATDGYVKGQIVKAEK